MISPTFTLIGGGEKQIKEIFADNAIFQAGESIMEADLIQVWDGETYVTYFFSSDAGGAWSLDGFDETGDAMPINGGFWVSRVGATVSATLCGEVVKTDVCVDVFGADPEAEPEDPPVVGEFLTQVGNPFAAPLPITSITAPDFQAAEDIIGADLIQTWDGETYVTYFFSSDAGNAWSTDGFDPTDDAIPIGGAFWIVRRGYPTTVTLPAPYTLD
jgi:hypothetical protein